MPPRASNRLKCIFTYLCADVLQIEIIDCDYLTHPYNYKLSRAQEIRREKDASCKSQVMRTIVVIFNRYKVLCRLYVRH